MQPLPPHLTGASFLFGETELAHVFTPEDMSSDQREMIATAEKFFDKEIWPHLEELEHPEPGHALLVSKLKKAGELGLLCVEMPEAHGGLGLGKVVSAGVSEQLNRLGGFGVSCGAHSGIGVGPIMYFGTEAQQAKYLPRLASGEWLAAYCLSEAGSGSDALGMKCKATLSPDGTHYVLDGTKMWITNAGFADVLVVFAKVDGQQVTAFIVERSWDGVSTGKEEHKLGIKTSSTRRVVLDNVQVPVENVLGEVGKGPYIAFNILNFGRFALGSGTTGAAKDLLRIATQYATERHQFGRPLTSFGMIQAKLGEMAARVYAAESMVFRTADKIDQVKATGERIDSIQPPFLRSLDEFAIECSIAKVACSEALDFVSDECIQIHGGYGFTEEYPAARGARDSRINRIFEGTNEINRLFIPATLLRRAQRGRLPLMAAVGKAMKEAGALLMGGGAESSTGDDLADARATLALGKKLAVLLLGAAFQKYGEKVADEQEVMAAIADIVIDLSLAESAVLRALKVRAAGAGSAAVHQDLAVCFANEAITRMGVSAQTAVSTLASGDELKQHLTLARRLLKWTPRNVTAMRRRISERLVAVGSFPALVAATAAEPALAK